MRRRPGNRDVPLAHATRGPARAAAAIAAGIAMAAGAGCGNHSDAVPPDTIGSAALAGSAPKPGAPPPSLPRTTDGATAVQRMVAAYKAMKTAQIRSEADIRYSYLEIPVVHQTTVLRYSQALPGVALEAQDPVNGTVQFIADGASVVQYTGTNNRFVQRTGGQTMTQAVAMINREAPFLVSPLQLLVSGRGSMPAGITAPKLTGEATVDGKQALVIQARFSDAFLRDFGQHIFAHALEPTKGDVTLYVDASTYLLLKSVIDVKWRGGTKIKTPELTSTERFTEVVPNPTFGPDDFRFIHPKGATEEVATEAGQ